MILSPLPNYFIVKINKQDQANRREKVGSLYLHFGEIHMQRNMQHGEIVAIGENANKDFPEASVGDTLIFHHFVEGASNDKSGWIHADEDYNYYNVTSCEYNGRRNETYGVWNGAEIIPHKDFVFIMPEKKKEEVSMEEFIETKTSKVGSLILFNDWQETREDKEAKTVKLKEEIKSLSKSSMNETIRKGIEEKELESAHITEDINKTRYLPYEVAYSNITQGIKKEVYALSAAALTEIEFMDKNYTVINYKYCAGTN